MSEALRWNDQLTEEQARVAGHVGSHVRLLAGPGTGKTYSMAGRVAFLVAEEKINPSEILVLTFTRLATRQLRLAIARRIAPYTKEMPYISTLHSFALRQLRRNARTVRALPQPLRIADDWEERTLIQEEMKDLLDCKAKEVKDGFALLSADWQTLKADEDGYMPDPKFLGAWDGHRRVYGYTLRAELVYQLKKAMEQVGEFVLEPNFKYVLIDEYQDLNPCDLAIAGAIANTGASLLACGDDDQSIYGFRFADPSGIRNFINDFAGSTDFALTECRRCGANILKAALWVAEQDIARVKKELHPREGQPPGEVHVLRFRTGDAEAQGIAKLCKKFIDDGISPSDILILVRSNHNGDFSAPVLRELTRLGVKAAANVDKETLLEEEPGRRLLSMLRLIAYPGDHLAWRSRLQLTDGIGPSTFKAIYDFAAANGIGFSDAIVRLHEFLGTIPSTSRGRLKTQVRAIGEVLERFRPQLIAQEAPEAVKTTATLKTFIQSIAETEITEEEGRGAVLDYIDQIADTSGAKTLEDLLVSIAIGQEEREETEAEPEEGSINILSMHQAKGLTAEVVFVMAAEDEIIPRNDDLLTVNDNRRLLYVSMTRAKQKLFMTYANMRTGKQVHSGRDPGNPRRTITRFLRDMRPVPTQGEAYVDSNS